MGELSYRTACPPAEHGERARNQGRFKSFPVQDDDHFDTVCRYVERHALRANLVQRAEPWRWGSLSRWNRARSEGEVVVSGLGASMLTARRLCEAGCGFVAVSLQGWDMHGNVKGGMNKRGPQVDRAVSAFVEDIYQRGLDQNILLVVSGEFGRTPRINKKAGRDHWGRLSTLALSGGGLQVGQVVGESSDKAEVPKSGIVTPQDLMATVFRVLGIHPETYFHDPSGRPIPMLADGNPISGLV